MLGHALQRRGRTLLNQQCWMWGRDTVRDEGNLLLEYGFERMRSPEGMTACTQYTQSFRQPATARLRIVRLWGWGFFYGEERECSSEGGASICGLFLNRFEFVPRAVPLLKEFCLAHEMAEHPRAQSLLLLAEALEWIAAYERFVLRQCGTIYRRRCLASWSKRQVPPEEVPGEWMRLSQEIAGTRVRLGRTPSIGSAARR